MKITQLKQRFMFYWLLGGVLFLFLMMLSFNYQIYEIFPAYGFIGYSLTILMVMLALSKAKQPWHYILVSMSLILFGTAASLDIVLSKQEMMIMLIESDSKLLRRLLEHHESLDDYVDVLLILLNVFTSAIAGNALFYGLNQRNFERQDISPD